jgi:uncharacterized lipoprotein YmbA
MNNRLAARCKWWPLALCTLLLSACITRPTTSTLYSLQPTRQQSLNCEFTAFHEIILLMPVHMAPHLQGRGLINQSAAGESRSPVSHLWAGSLDQQIAQQLADNLKDLLATDNVAIYPGPRFGTIRYQLEIEMSEFSGNGRSFTTTAVYTLSDTNSKTILHRKTFRQTRPIDKPDYSGYVESASQAIADLSKEVAAALLAAHSSHPLPAAHL